MSSARDRYSDLITESYEIKKLVRETINSNGIRLYALCEREKLSYDRIKFWLNTVNSDLIRGVVAQNDIIKLAESIGIGIRVTVTVNRNYDAGDDVRHVRKKVGNTAPKNTVYETVRQHERERRAGRQT